MRTFLALGLAIATLLLGAASPAQAQSPATPAEAAFQRRDYPAAATLARQECDRGSQRGCAVLGLMLFEGRGAPADPAGGRAILERACAQKSPEACINLGLTWQSRSSSDPAKARAAFDTACALGSGEGCGRQGVMMWRGQGGDPDHAAARAKLQRGCSLKSGFACQQLGSAFLIGGGGAPPDRKAAAAALQVGCDLGHAPSCRSAGELFIGGQGVTPDYPATLRALGAACGLGDEQSCVDLRSLARSRPDAMSRASLRATFAKACNSAKALECVRAGVLAAEAATTPDQFDAAATLAGRGCSNATDTARACDLRTRLRSIAGQHRACLAGGPADCGALANLIVYFVDDSGESIDVKAALSLPRRHAKAACDAGAMAGCSAAAWVSLLDGQAAARPQALALAGRACSGGEPKACELVGWLGVVEVDERMNFIRDLSDRYSDTDADWGRLAAAWRSTKPALERGCNAGWADGCVAYLLRQPLMEAPVEGEPLLRKACRRVAAFRCYELASVLLNARFERGSYTGLLENKFGCAVTEGVCRAFGRWYQGQAGNSPNAPYNGPYAKLGVAMMDEACTGRSAHACQWLAIYYSPTDAGAVKQRGVNAALSAQYARKTLALDPENRYAKSYARGS